MLSAGLILFLAALQGLTELFPVSSLGHAVVVPPLVGLNFRESDPSFVPVLTVLHLGTAAALLFLYRRDWARIIAGFIRAAVRGRVETADERLSLLLVVGSVPAGVIGLFLQDPLKSLFGNPRLASGFLIVNGGILLAAEWFRRRDEHRRAAAPAPVLGHEEGDPDYQAVEGLSLRTAIFVGIFQAGALLPGISRSGITMAAGTHRGPAARGGGSLLLPSGDPDHPRGRVARGPVARLRRPDRAGERRRGRRRRARRIRQRALPAPLPQDRAARPLRVLLCGSRGGGPRVHPLSR